MKKLVKACVTFFGIGNLPMVPGTLGSLAGLCLAWFSNAYLFEEFLALSFIGFLMCRPATEVYGTKDPQRYVLDEVCGMMLSVLFLPLNALIFLIGFILFRIFDSWKPWPISLIQKSDRPSAILWDDLAAGLAVNVILQGLNLYAPLGVN